jgi:hypothetical protein
MRVTPPDQMKSYGIDTLRVKVGAPRLSTGRASLSLLPDRTKIYALL